MKDYSVRKYLSSDFEIWNLFVATAKNATFLFNRGFMDYHQDRFSDFSLMIFKRDKLVSILPAHQIDNQIYSHYGLTYGGLVVEKKAKLTEVIAMFQATLQFLNAENIQKLHIKTIPDIYVSKPSSELQYALFLVDATLTRRDSLSVIDQTNGYFPSKDRRSCALRGRKKQLVIKEEAIFDEFWNEILIPNLTKKHHASPVHSLDEIKLLHHRFPENIRHFNVYHENKLVAGTTVFVTDNVAHPQYISGNEDKNELGSLDFLYHHLISDVFKEKRYFDFGISNEQQGRKLNGGIVFWKESFGASTIVQDFYTVETNSFHKLENVLI